MPNRFSPIAIAVLLVGLPLAARPVAAQDEADSNPLLDIASDMNSAATQLGKWKTGKPAQDPQRSALSKLDALIAELEKQQRAGRGGSVNPNPTRPAADSVIRSGPGGMGKLHAERREGKQWGELPPKERERILQSLQEGFPGHYQKILERYFARLAEEKVPAGDEPADTAPPPADAVKGATNASGPAKEQR